MFFYPVLDRVASLLIVLAVLVGYPPPPPPPNILYVIFSTITTEVFYISYSLLLLLRGLIFALFLAFSRKNYRENLSTRKLKILKNTEVLYAIFIN